MGDRVKDSLLWRPTNPLAVKELCRSLDPHKGMGYDGGLSVGHQDGARDILGSLSHLFNCCIRGCHFPAFFKVARIMQVFKSEDPTEFSNYRPISVLPMLSQVFERVLEARLLEFLDLQGVINPGQYGFRVGHSTAMAIQDMVERVRGAWNNRRATFGVFIDLKKAFHMVDHGVLLAKLEHYGVRGEVLRLLGSYLERQFQYVVYNGVNPVGGWLGVGSRRVQFWGPCFS
jgi:hypothetical protein